MFTFKELWCCAKFERKVVKKDCKLFGESGVD